MSVMSVSLNRLYEQQTRAISYICRGFHTVVCTATASGKLLQCVEGYLQKEMSTLYANTHTTTSITGIQTSKFRAEARSIILQSMHDDADQDVVIFAGREGHMETVLFACKLGERKSHTVKQETLLKRV